MKHVPSEGSISEILVRYYLSYAKDFMAKHHISILNVCGTVLRVKTMITCMDIYLMKPSLDHIQDAFFIYLFFFFERER